MERSDAVVSLVVRLLSEPARAGRLVGHAEIVETGDVVQLRDEGDLARLVEQVSADAAVAETEVDSKRA